MDKYLSVLILTCIMKQYNIVETFEIDGQTYEAGSVAELSDELVARISSSFISPVEEAVESEEANGDEAADVAAEDAAADAADEGADEDAE